MLEDVHLDLDPRTASTKRPILLADCEGLDGVDREPVGSRPKARFRKDGGILAPAVVFLR